MEEITPGNLFDHVPCVYVRFLIGDKIADLLDVHAHNEALLKLVPKITAVFFNAEDHAADNSGLIKQMLQHFNLALMQGMLNYYNEEKGVHFYVPPDLKKNWKLRETWDTAVKLSPSFFGFRFAIERKSSTI